MPLRRLAVSLSLFALLLAPDAVSAAPKGEGADEAKLPPPCVAAGVQSMAECQALLKRAGPRGKAPAGGGEAPAAEPRKPAPKPEAPAAEAPKPEAPKPEAIKPEAPRPEAPKPEAPRPEAPKPEVPKPEAPKPEIAKPEAPKPEIAKPETAKPAAPQPELRKPEAAKPAPVAPAAEAPDCTTPAAARTLACRAERQRERGRGKPAGTPAPAAPAAPAGAEAPAANPVPAPAPKAPAPAATPTSPAAPKAPAPAAPVTPAASAPAAPTAAPEAAAAPKGPPGQPAPDCLAVGISTAAQCDAFHARRQHRQGAAAPGGEQAAGARQPREPLGKLPPGVKPDQLAPLLDSAKQREAGGGQTPPAAAAARTPQAPPPANDEAAQASFRTRKAPPLPPPAAQPTAGKPPSGGIVLPQNVTVVNETVVTNTTVNNTTINNNSVNNTTVNNEVGRRGHRGGFGGPGTPPPGAIPPPPPGAPRPEAWKPNPIGLAIGAVLQLGDRLIVDSSGRDQYRISGRDRYHTEYADLPHDRYVETIYRPDGVRIVTIYDRNGDILRRSRFDADGHEIVLAYFDSSRYPDHGWGDPGADLPPLRLDVNVNNYVLDAGQADESRIQHFLAQPPVEPVPRLYSIDQVERSARLRDMMPRIELADLTFDTGSATLAPDQVQELGGVADAMLALLRRNPAETFLIEGHTDAVGSPASNLVLSDARAAEVAEILTDVYHVPPENLATQGYGAEFLRIQTAGPERLNRRVVIRRITPLVTIAQGQD